MIIDKRTAGLPDGRENDTARRICAGADELYDAVGVLDKAIAGSDSPADAEAAAFYMKNEVLPAMQDVRAVSDALETNIGREYWPFPVYGDIILH